MCFFTRKQKKATEPSSQASSGTVSASRESQAGTQVAQPVARSSASAGIPSLATVKTTQALWERAYDDLKIKENELVDDYERILSSELKGGMSDADKLPSGSRPDASDPAADVSNDIDQTSHKGRKDQMNMIIEQGLKRIDDRKIKYRIAGTEYVLQDQLDQAVKLVLLAKDFVGEAVKACPQASLAWAGVCLVLPIFSNPSTADKANLEGIAYVTSKMRYYCVLEELLLPQNLNPSGHDVSGEKFREEFESHVLELYRLLLKFQMKSVCRYYRSRIGNLRRDIVNPNEWKQMVLSIEKQETAIEKESQQINTERSLLELKGLLRNSEAVLGCFTSLLSLMQEQLSVAKEHRDISSQHLELSRRKEQRQISQEEQRCLQIFSRTDYRWYKDRIDSRVEGTCQWFLTQENYKHWLQQPSGLLLVSADAGCGKSVLAKFLVDEELPRSATICYFFFKDGDQNNAKQALCALLHQLLSQKYHLIKHALPAFDRNGENLPNQFSTLWDVLTTATADPEVGEVICVLDALDECEESEMQTLISDLTKYFRSRQTRTSKLKFLLTSRPYHNIVNPFQGLVDNRPYIRIPGEEHSEVISKEVNHVIRHKVKTLANLRPDLTKYLEQMLLEITHRTYLWVFLVFEYLRTTQFKKTKKGVQDAVKTLPKSTEEAYEKILNKALDKAKARKLLSIIIAAYRPLTLKEMNIALEITLSSKSVEDLDLENETDFKGTIRQCCGLFVSIHQDKIYLIHQTAKEFLLQDTEISPSLPEIQGRWGHSISLKEGNRILAESCVTYLSFDAFETGFCPTDEEFEARLQLNPLYDYAARNWGYHARAASTEVEKLILGLLESDAKVSAANQAMLASRRFSSDSGYSQRVSRKTTGIHLAAYFGLTEAIIALLKSGHDPNSIGTWSRTPLSWAAAREHEAVVKLLLEKGAELESNKYGRTPLSWAAKNGHGAVMKLLLYDDKLLLSTGRTF